MMSENKSAQKRILLVEDEADICKILSFRLRKEGYQVDIVNDGEEGLQEAKNHTPDLIILDLMLPTMQGEDVCKALREDDERPDLQKVPILMLTAKSDEVDRIIGKVIGANSYMAKPFEIEDLLREVKRMINPK